MKKKIYWIDDETRFYPIISMLCPSEVELIPYAGLDRAADFINDLGRILIENSESREVSYFLIDILMPVPNILENHTLWQKNLPIYNKPNDKESVCGLALAYLIFEELEALKNEKNLDSKIKVTDRIKLLTSYSHHMRNNIGLLKIDGTPFAEIIISKSELNTEHLKAMLKDKKQYDLPNIK